MNKDDLKLEVSVKSSTCCIGRRCTETDFKGHLVLEQVHLSGSPGGRRLFGVIVFDFRTTLEVVRNDLLSNYGVATSESSGHRAHLMTDSNTNDDTEDTETNRLLPSSSLRRVYGTNTTITSSEDLGKVQPSSAIDGAALHRTEGDCMALCV